MVIVYDPLMKKFRLNLDFSPAVEERLRRLKMKTDASSFTEVFRRALAVYELMTDYHKEGFQIILRKEDTEHIVALIPK